MLKHSDRNDAIKGAGDVAVIDQFKLHLIRNTRRLGTLARDEELLFGERYARDRNARDAVEIESKPTPATANIKHGVARLKTELSRDVRELILLRGFERVFCVREIGAAILPVSIEEQIIEAIRQVIMMRDIRFGPGAVIAWQQPVDPARVAPKRDAALIIPIPTHVIANQI